MAAFDPATLDRWRALAIVDRDGTTVGTIKEFYLDRETGYPTWALVNTGLFGTTQTFVPLVHATEISDGLQVPYEKSHIKDTPKVDLHDELSPEEEAELFAHYGVDYQPSPEARSDEGLATAAPPTPGTPESADPDSETPAEGPGPVRAEAGSESPPTAVDGEAPEAVPPDPAPVDPAGSGHDTPGFEAASDAVPGEPDTTRSDTTNDPGQTEPGTIPSDATNDPAQAELGTIQSDATNGAAPAEPGIIPSDATNDGTRVEPGTLVEPANDAVPSEPGTTEADGTTPPEPDPDPERSRPEPHDPDLGLTAPVEPGLPGSTASSPYGSTPTTVDKDVTDPSDSNTEEPLRAPGEAGWAPGAAGSFEEHEQFDRSTAASDRWREAKLAAERDRVARTAAPQPEERSPLERARRRLERLVGGGQDHPDEVSPADREAAERARRARLGLDEDDQHSP
jgi:hypothetical protein